MEDNNLYAMRHSLAHITAAAVKRLWPEAKFGVGPVVDDGFYYDIDLGDNKISEQDFPKIESKMKEIISENQDLFVMIVRLMTLLIGLKMKNKIIKRNY